MEKYFNAFSNISAVIGGTLVYLLGGWDSLIEVLVYLMCIDYFTGILKALYLKKLSSNVGYKGIIKKVIMLSIVSVAVLCEKMGIPAVREIVITFFCANEGISILENAAETGINLPDKLKDSLLQIRNKK